MVLLVKSDQIDPTLDKSTQIVTLSFLLLSRSSSVLLTELTLCRTLNLLKEWKVSWPYLLLYAMTAFSNDGTRLKTRSNLYTVVYVFESQTASQSNTPGRSSLTSFPKQKEKKKSLPHENLGTPSQIHTNSPRAITFVRLTVLVRFYYFVITSD